MSLDFDSDSMALLNFFSHSDSNINSTGSFITGNAGSPEEAADLEMPQQFFPASSNWAPDPLIRGLENIVQNCGLDGLDDSFDWLSWDQCDVPTS